MSEPNKNAYTGPDMFINQFQEQTVRTANSDMGLVNGCFGLIGETGEVVDAIKKYIYQGHSEERTRAKVKDELGDVMWYICRIAAMWDLPMSEILSGNIDKLRCRYPEGFSVERSINRNTEDK